MNDGLQILGVLLLVFIGLVFLSGKSPAELINGAGQYEQDLVAERGETDVFTSDWFTRPFIQTQSAVVVEEDNDGVDQVFVVPDSIRESQPKFANSASRDDRNGEIIVASKNAPVVVASASSSGIVLNSEGIILIIILIIMIGFIVFLISKNRRPGPVPHYSGIPKRYHHRVHKNLHR
ncbi:hypothetical protein CL684_01410 [Candidatus Campbellbacteria bacterium]|nr:hypothetical protein [Candidatus Campbellbacteria bacterium]